MSDHVKYDEFFSKYNVPIKPGWLDPDNKKGLCFQVNQCPCCGFPGMFMIDRQRHVYHCSANPKSWKEARNMWKHYGRDNFLTLDNILAASDPEWLIHNHLPKKLITVIFGPPETCKSFFELDRLLTVAYGVDYHDDTPVEQGKCVYLYAEGGSDGSGLKRRVAAWLKHHQISRDDPGKKNIMFSTYRYDLSLEQQVEKLVDNVKTNFGAIDVIAIDTLAKHFNAKENEEMTLMVNAACDLANMLNCAVDIIHHTGKDKTKGERGGSALRGGVDWSFELSGGDEDNSETIFVTPRKRKDGRKVPEYGLKMEEIKLSDRPHDTSLVLVPTKEKIVDKITSTRMDRFDKDMSTLMRIITHDWIDGADLKAIAARNGIHKDKFADLVRCACRDDKIEKRPDQNHSQKWHYRHKPIN